MEIDDSLNPNPGTVMASELDAEIARFRQLQQDVAQLHSDLQILTGQATKNEMVLQELNLVQAGTGAGGAKNHVYKMIGPALIPQNALDAVQTVQKRIEFITAEQRKLTSKIADTEKEGDDLAGRIQQMQAALQQTTAQAVQAIAAQHQQQQQQT
jgi:prefoldin beta subunit